MFYGVTQCPQVRQKQRQIFCKAASPETHKLTKQDNVCLWPTNELPGNDKK